MACGDVIRRMIKVDTCTIKEQEDMGDLLSMERSAFARPCIEVDLRKQLIFKVKIRKKIY